MPTFRRANADDFDAFFDLGRLAFPMLPETDRDMLRERFRPEHTSVVEDNGQMIARSSENRFGHWLGGRPVPAIGIAGVAVNPTIRGRGTGSQMMRWTHEQARADGVPLASLYPATLPIYRSLGYGDAFFRTTFKARLDQLPPRPHDAGSVEPYTDADLPALMAAYDRYAATQAGVLVRNADWWQLRVLDRKVASQRYLVREDGHVTGWLFFEFKPAQNDWRQRLEVRDLGFTTESAGRALLAFAALHRSTSIEMTWCAPINEPIQFLQHDHAIEMEWGIRAMARILDVPGAIAARGYLGSVDAEVSIALTDADIPENAGPWLLSVAKGAGVAERSKKAELTCTIQAFSSMFTGMLSPRDAQRVGALDGGDGAIERLAAMFAGPLPWLGDFY